MKDLEGDQDGVAKRGTPAESKDFEKKEIHKISNQKVLAITTLSFGIFVVAEVIGALV